VIPSRDNIVDCERHKHENVEAEKTEGVGDRVCMIIVQREDVVAASDSVGETEHIREKHFFLTITHDR
jgi:hypothetical protein